ncbi:hypothetical protein [Corynebacterium sp. A21]|uniref:hypothetical protein n=1 Tax=Corynebacterium sp. A21 TaxID=3457318 RepID=UPI003FD3A649
MYSSLEIIDLEDHAAVFTHPAGFTHLAEAGLRTTMPLLVPVAMEVFAESGALSDFVWKTAGPDCPFLYVLEDAIPVPGVSPFGTTVEDRLLGAFTVRSVASISGSSDYVLAKVVREKPTAQDYHLLYPAALAERFGVGSVLWGTFDRLRNIGELPTEQVTASRHPNLIFRVVMSLSRGDKDLWELMLELGESASTIIGAVDLAVQDGILINTVEGPPLRFQFYEPAQRSTHADPNSITGRGGRDVRGIPMDEPAYHSLLAILAAVMSTPSLMADEKLVQQTRQFLRLLSASAPRRVLAEHTWVPALRQQAGDGELDWEGLAGWIAEEPPEAAGTQMILEAGAAVNSQVLAQLQRACADWALLRVELKDGSGLVLEARQLGYDWSVERRLKGFDRATGRSVKLKLSLIHSVEYLALPWRR